MFDRTKLPTMSPDTSGIGVFGEQGNAILKDLQSRFDPQLPRLGEFLKRKNNPVPYENAGTVQPKINGALYQALERAALKQARNEALSPTEAQLLQHYMGLIR